MKFAGFIKNSFVDYPNEIATVVFTLGCNFNCWYCHNKDLIEKDNKELKLIDEKEVLDFLKNKKGLIDGVVITGGEPTLQKDLKNFIIKVKNIGFKVKLDTNGTNPDVLKDLIGNNLLDFVAMDIKTSFKKYEDLIERKCNINEIQKSIKVLMSSNINYEFRTTFSPDILVEDIEEIAKYISGAKSYVIQKYFDKHSFGKTPHSKSYFEEAKNTADKYVKTFLRSVD